VLRDLATDDAADVEHVAIDRSSGRRNPKEPGTLSPGDDDPRPDLVRFRGDVSHFESDVGKALYGARQLRVAKVQSVLGGASSDEAEESVQVAASHYSRRPGLSTG
jgi:hypothetical protein